jgi:hypothetical protein
MNFYITDRYNRKCLVLRPGTDKGAPALVQQPDGTKIELYYEDTITGGRAFYGLERPMTGQKLANFKYKAKKRLK